MPKYSLKFFTFSHILCAMVKDKNTNIRSKVLEKIVINSGDNRNYLETDTQPKIGPACETNYKHLHNNAVVFGQLPSQMAFQGTTFQEQHKTYFKCALVFGLYPPGIEKIIKSKIILRIFWYLSLAPILLAVPSVLGFINYLLFNGNVPIVLRLQIFRRMVMVIYIASELAAHVLRFRTIEDLYHRWNYVINKEYCTIERKLIIDGMIKSSTKLLLAFGSVRFLTSNLYNIPLWFNRYIRGSELAGFPHDVESPYHFYFVGYQTIFFLWFSIAVFQFEFLYCYLICMAEAEIKVLSHKLAEILSTITISDDNQSISRISPTKCEVTIGSREYKEAVQKVNRELVRWLKAQYEANKWLKDLKEFMHLIITIKYLYLGIHCSLVVTGLKWAGAQWNELLLLLIVSVANFSFCFYATAQVDSLYDNSGRLFLDAYGQQWYLYPISTQKMLAFIATFVQARPINFVGFKGYRDSKENFSAVLQTAYQVLTFILSMDES